MAAERRSQASGAPFYAEYRLIARGGRVIWVRDEAKTVPDDAGQPLYLRGVILDITERKCAEEALVEERALLARRIEERTADLSAANAELARAARLKDEFLASMSHELRTPLNVEFQPDLIMLDILLPDVSGWDVLAQLKADLRTQAIPIMVVSVVDERLRALELGAAGCLLKPITRNDILHILGVLASGADQATARALPSTPPVVLLAEDNEANVAMISDYLGTHGYQVIVARNGAEAIARTREVRPAIVLMDIQMPGMDGLEATRRIRADRDLAALPIIALTALSMPGDRKRCLEAGANDYLSKPVGMKGLAATIEGYLLKPPPGIRTLPRFCSRSIAPKRYVAGLSQPPRYKQAIPASW